MAVKAVLFDLDDTLIDHRHAARCAMVGVRERFAPFRTVSLEAFESEHHRILDLLHHEVAIGRRPVDEARIERYRRLFAFVGDDGRHASAAAELHRRVYQASRRPVDGALALLEALRADVRIAVVTNNTVAEQSEKLATFGLAPLVGALVTSEEIGAAKPDERIFLAALQRLDVTGDEAVMVGDSWLHDVQGALGAGIAAVWFNRTGEAHPGLGAIEELRALHPAQETAARIVATQSFCAAM
jgi:putative hydrolase of the HAD superfamily